MHMFALDHFAETTLEVVTGSWGLIFCGVLSELGSSLVSCGLMRLPHLRLSRHHVGHRLAHLLACRPSCLLRVVKRALALHKLPARCAILARPLSLGLLSLEMRLLLGHLTRHHRLLPWCLESHSWLLLMIILRGSWIVSSRWVLEFAVGPEASSR